MRYPAPAMHTQQVVFPFNQHNFLAIEGLHIVKQAVLGPVFPGEPVLVLFTLILDGKPGNLAILGQVRVNEEVVYKEVGQAAIPELDQARAYKLVITVAPGFQVLVQPAVRVPYPEGGKGFLCVPPYLLLITQRPAVVHQLAMVIAGRLFKDGLAAIQGFFFFQGTARRCRALLAQRVAMFFSQPAQGLGLVALVKPLHKVVHVPTNRLSLALEAVVALL